MSASAVSISVSGGPAVGGVAGSGADGEGSDAGAGSVAGAGAETAGGALRADGVGNGRGVPPRAAHAARHMANTTRHASAMCRLRCIAVPIGRSVPATLHRSGPKPLTKYVLQRASRLTALASSGE